MKKYILALSAVLMVMVLVLSCSKKQSAVVGQAVDITITKAGENVTKYLWAFKKKPADSKLDPRDFLPSDDAEAVSFVPDVPGDYEVIVAMIGADGKEFNQTFEYEVTGEALAETSEKPAPETAAMSDTPTVTPEKTEVPVKEKAAEAKPETPKAKAAAAPSDGKTWKEVPETRKTASRTSSPVSSSTAANSIPKKKDLFTIQVASFKTYEKAKKESDALAKAGFTATIQRAYFKDNDEIWYRVRVGSFSNKQEARATLYELKKKTGREAWIDNVREDS